MALDRGGDHRSAMDDPVAASAGKPPPFEGQQFKRVLTHFLPGPLKEIVEKGLLRALLALVAAFVVVPLIVAFLAAFWLALAAKWDATLVKGLRSWYLETIYEGFAIEALASRSHARLDYLQAFDFNLRPSSPRKDLVVNMLQGQEAALDFSIVAFTSDGPSCPTPEQDIDLVAVTLGNQQVMVLTSSDHATTPIGSNWWKEHIGKFEQGDPIRRLSFRLTEAARRLKCGEVHVEGSLRVFKMLHTGAR